MTPAPKSFVGCSHCGAPVPHSGHGAALFCESCRGWTLLGRSESAALRVAHIQAHYDEAAALATLRARTGLAGLGPPQVVDAQPEWVSYLAREGVLRALVRHMGALDERTLAGLLAIPPRTEPNLPLEVIDPAALVPDEGAAPDPPEVSLDDFDGAVRLKAGELIRQQLDERGLAASVIDLHSNWGPDVRGVRVPVLRVHFTLSPPVGPFGKVIASHARFQVARIGMHDGCIKHIELPVVERGEHLVLALTIRAVLVAIMVVLALLAAAVPMLGS